MCIGVHHLWTETGVFSPASVSYTIGAERYQIVLTVKPFSIGNHAAAQQRRGTRLQGPSFSAGCPADWRRPKSRVLLISAPSLTVSLVHIGSYRQQSRRDGRWTEFYFPRFKD